MPSPVTIARISLVYDVAAGIPMLVATSSLASLFGVPPPEPLLFGKLLGIFLICVGLGYLAPMRNPSAHRSYLWIFGVVLKSAGAIAFVADHWLNHSPASFLVFAVGDGTLALATWAALVSSSRRSSDPR